MSLDEAILSRPEGPSDLDGGQNPHAIVRLGIEGLFDQYDYDLPKRHKHQDLSRLFILYGDNGSGKTTLLKLVYHALSTERDPGHWSFVARTCFKRLAIEFHDKTVVEIRRTVKRTGGTLHLAVYRDSRSIADCDLEFDETMGVPGNERVDRERLDEFLREISSLEIHLYYLSDDRKHQGDLITGPRDAEEPGSWMAGGTVKYQFQRTLAGSWGYYKEAPGAGVPDSENASLTGAMKRVSDWVRQQVRRGSTRGQESADTIYSRVVSDIAHSQEARWDDVQSEAESLIAILQDLERQCELYHQYGLIPKLSAAQDLINNLRAAERATLPVMCSVIRPHVEGIVARLEALRDIYRTVDRLIQTLNKFYRNKVVRFSVDGGFEIRPGEIGDKTMPDDTLNPVRLSSGEKQLFLLLCNTVLARRHAGLFLIDEPDLSLNVKWQRQLVQAILDNSEESNVQFLLATHSIELITQHRAHVVRLIGRPHRAHGREGTTHGGEDV